MSILPILMQLDDEDDYFGNRFGSGIFANDLLPNSGYLSIHQHPTHYYTGYRRPWAITRRESSPNQRTSSTSDMALKSVITKDGFQVCLDVQHFSPNEITVKTVDTAIVVEGKHEEREDGHGFISRQFIRRYVLPKQFNIKDVQSTLSSDGVLTITAPPLAKAIEGNEKVIQIQQTGPARLNIKDTAENKNIPEKSTDKQTK